MLRFRQTVLIFGMMLMAVGILPAVSVAADRPTKPRDVTTHRVDDKTVRLQWRISVWKPENARFNQPVRRYKVLRDGQVVANVRVSDPLSPTHKDVLREPGSYSYTVVGVGSDGSLSEPSDPQVIDTSTGAGSTEPERRGNSPAPDDESTQFQAAAWCRDFPRPGNGREAPTPAEKYSCSAAASDLPNDYNGKPWRSGDYLLEGWGFLLSFWVTINVFWYLATSSLLGMTLAPSSYMGLAMLMAGLVRGLTGDANYDRFAGALFTIGVCVLAVHIARRAIHAVFKLAAFVLLTSVALSFFVSNITQVQSFGVTWPLDKVNRTIGSVQGLAEDTSATRANVRFSVIPSFGNNKGVNARRRSENDDWVRHQYLPRCKQVFDDIDFATKANYPGTNMPWCERWWHVRGTGSDDEIDAFKDKLKETNKDIYDYFRGRVPFKRGLYVFVDNGQSLIHNVLKMGVATSIWGSIILLVLLLGPFGLMALAAASGLAKELRHFAYRHFGQCLYLFVVMMIGAAVLLSTYLLEAYIYSNVLRVSYLAMAALGAILNILMGLLAVYIWLSVRRRKQAQKERLGASPKKHRIRQGLGFGARVAVTGAVGELGSQTARRMLGRNGAQDGGADARPAMQPTRPPAPGPRARPASTDIIETTARDVEFVPNSAASSGSSSRTALPPPSRPSLPPPSRPMLPRGS